MNTQRHARQEQRFSVANFLEYGQRHAIDYRFPALGSAPQRSLAATVVQGYVDEHLLPSGLSVTCSDLQIVQPYETTSAGHSPLYILVVVSGCVQLWLNGEPQLMRGGMALATSIGDRLELKARHDAGQRLVAITLGINPARFQPGSEIATLLGAWQQRYPGSEVWQIPDHLLTGLRGVLQPCADPLVRQLMLEGLLLQLLAQQLLAEPAEAASQTGTAGTVSRSGMAKTAGNTAAIPQESPPAFASAAAEARADAVATAGITRPVAAASPQSGMAVASLTPPLPPGERARLEQVRQLIAASPEQPHTLAELARAAAMSPSSLRSKFRQAYGDSVFNYLRDCRLAQARRYLQQGHSVQQAAWMSGYQHASNFATAFRRRYGVAPSALQAG
ncbi:helix-turn-helix transcriptional regulator [Erwinia sp. B116]|uniref:helix-turn-helix transcriptional regulator n=1 Tax=Erwinia sp. B116 TaxID=1561024 RepID=UPI000CBD9893|nr:AraC family transcriptional regulator [Erwinia sp. B116]PLV54487.1 hypothetical protein NV64_17840 [Erwinia sp. B116]